MRTTGGCGTGSAVSTSAPADGWPSASVGGSSSGWGGVSAVAAVASSDAASGMSGLKPASDGCCALAAVSSPPMSIRSPVGCALLSTGLGAVAASGAALLPARQPCNSYMKH